MIRRGEMWLLSLSTLVSGGTGLLLYYMKEWLEPTDPFSVLNHPWQPYVLKTHLVAVPFLIFAVGLVFSSHAVERFRAGKPSGRSSGVGLLALFIPLVLSGIGVQIFTAETWQRGAVWIHLIAGAAYMAFFMGHRLSMALRAKPRRRQVVPLASHRADT